MGRKPIKNEFKDFFLETCWLTGALEAGVMVGNWYLGYESDYLWPLVAGPGYIALMRWLSLRPRRLAPNFQIVAGRFTTGRPVPVNRRETWLLRSVPFLSTKTIKYREPARTDPAGQFFWEVKIPERLDLVTVRDTKLLKFCQIAYERQNKGVIHPMSRNYFIKELKWPYAPYRACTVILDTSNLVDNRRQGASGRLLHPPGPTVRYAKHLYPLLVDE